MSVITSLADAITKMEGYYPGSLAWRNNNPGNIRGGRVYPQYPLDSNGFTVFPDQATGRAALEADMAYKVGQGMTLESLVYKYAPPTDNNDSAQYVANMASWTGLPVNVPLNSLDSSGYSGSTARPLPDSGSFLSSFLPDWTTGAANAGTGDQEASVLPQDNTALYIGLAVAGVVALILLTD